MRKHSRSRDKKRCARQGAIPLVSKLMLPVAAMGLAACGSSSDAASDTAAGTTARQQAALPNGGTATGTPAVAAHAALPAAALAAWERHARGECRDMGARFGAVRFIPIQSVDPEREPAANEGVFFAAEFNGDGRPDFVVTTENGGCAGEPDYGKMGPPHDFIVSTADGYQAAYGFNGYIDPKHVRRRDKRDVIEYNRGWNGDCGYVETIVWAWTGTKMEAIERRNDKGQLVDNEGCAIAAASKQASASGKLPILDGLWAGTRHGGCAGMKAPDGGPDFIIAGNKMNFAQDYMELTPVQSLGGGRYRAGKDYDKMVIRLNGPKSLVMEEGPMGKGDAFVWCSPATEWEAWYE